MALTDNLVSYWKLDEASGNALDAHGANDLTDTNSVGSSASGKIGNARDFESGSFQYFARADNAALSLTGSFTISAWVRAESLTGVVNGICNKWNLTGNQRSYVLQWNSTFNRFQLAISSSGSTATTLNADNFGAPSLAVWYHICAWYDLIGTTMGISINNGTPNTNTLAAGAFDSTAAFEIGRGTTTTLGDTWDGLIDEMGIWSRALTSTERGQLYNGGAGLAYPLSAGGSKLLLRLQQAGLFVGAHP